MLFLVFFAPGCRIFKPKKEKTMTGYTTEQQLLRAPQSSWLEPGISSYVPDMAVIGRIREQVAGRNISWLAIGGTWCGDTQFLLPQFVRVMREAQIPASAIRYYLVDEQKTSPAQLEKTLAVTRVPVFIVMENEREIGRITESVATTTEADLLRILEGK